MTKFAQRLSRAEVDIDLRLRAGLPHAFDVIAPRASATTEAVQDRISFLRRTLAELDA